MISSQQQKAKPFQATVPADGVLLTAPVNTDTMSAKMNGTDQIVISASTPQELQTAIKVMTDEKVRTQQVQQKKQQQKVQQKVQQKAQQKVQQSVFAPVPAAQVQPRREQQQSSVADNVAVASAQVNAAAAATSALVDNVRKDLSQGNLQNAQTSIKATKLAADTAIKGADYVNDNASNPFVQQQAQAARLAAQKMKNNADAADKAIAVLAQQEKTGSLMQPSINAVSTQLDRASDAANQLKSSAAQLDRVVPQQPASPTTVAQSQKQQVAILGQAKQLGDATSTTTKAVQQTQQPQRKAALLTVQQKLSQTAALGQAAATVAAAADPSTRGGADVINQANVATSDAMVVAKAAANELPSSVSAPSSPGSSAMSIPVVTVPVVNQPQRRQVPQVPQVPQVTSSQSVFTPLSVQKLSQQQQKSPSSSASPSQNTLKQVRSNQQPLGFYNVGQAGRR